MLFGMSKSFHSFPQLTSVPIKLKIKITEDLNSKNTTATSGIHDTTNIPQKYVHSSWHDFYRLRKRARFYSWGGHGNSSRLGDIETTNNRIDRLEETDGVDRIVRIERGIFGRRRRRSLNEQYLCKPLESRIPLEQGLGDSISKVEASEYSFQILTTESKLYSTGLGKLGLVDTDHKKVKFFSSGRTEYVAVNENNELLIGDAQDNEDNTETRKIDVFGCRSVSLPHDTIEYKPKNLNIYKVKAGWHKASCRDTGLSSGIILWYRPHITFQTGLNKCNACIIPEMENDPISDYLLLSQCMPPFLVMFTS
ncbi:unnamed protein product [Ambrosiozyma monospora]|uniref:Unnamed protein product n=1 Tax=Ambrosiozyma monospora TaxID=43982 RepID=A0ACB5STG0_AMBMO|nr:unnamed protein product [Ambrosiozyma monospora]